MPKKEDLMGQKFNHLTVIAPALSRNGKTYWLCKCDCGNEKEIQTSHLKNGSIKTCGCNMKDEPKICEICGKSFTLIAHSTTRKYCYECSPTYTNGTRVQSLTILMNAMRNEAVKRKGGKCQKCGYDRCINALEFHHRNPEEKEISLSKGSTYSWNKYWNEVQKCDLLCANCHREEHARLNGTFND